MIDTNDILHPSLNKFQTFQGILVYSLKCPQESAESLVESYLFFCNWLRSLNSSQIALNKFHASEFPTKPKFFVADFPSRRHSGP